ncbi:SpoIIE family protein phosphatase [Haliovirga abyssi]|nr:SpoIIE family protein phosphatase [Haliovirga abyssi]
MISATVYKNSLNKFGEQVCGDNYQLGKTEDSKLIILSDGMGSGIKASILSILTTEIIGTMYKKGVKIEEIVDTITKTLPVCKVRGIAYSTFTLVQIFKSGKVKIINYDNPSPVILTKGELYKPKYITKRINEKDIKITEFEIFAEDFIFIMSDGLVHAGLGRLMNFGWGEENIANYLKRMYRKTREIKYIVDSLIAVTESYYGFEPGDDSTLIGIKSIENPIATIFTGPPLNPKTDEYYVKRFFSRIGKKVICGGTTSNIVSRVLDEEIEIKLEGEKLGKLPPTGTMKGVDLITEGVLTLKYLNRMLDKCKDNMHEINIPEKMNSGEKLFSILTECDEVNILVGRKVNAFYHNPNLPFDMSIRSTLIRGLSKNLERLGKTVNIEYC